MGQSRAPFRAGSFAFVVLCYVLPFLTVSCPGYQRSISGFQVATGFTVEEPQMFAQPKQTHVNGEPLALAALVCAAIGIFAGLSKGSGGRMASILLAAGGGILLFILQSKVGQQAQAQGQGVLAVKFEVGYWLALAGFAGALISTLMSGAGDKGPADSVPIAPPPPVPR